jgi:hypothetical protein
LSRCAQLGLAPDADWLFESLPVDYAAGAMLALDAGRREGLEVHHLRHPRPRHWRELMLWLHLSGHRLKLVPTAVWLERAFARDAGDCGPVPLWCYRRLFVDRADRVENGEKGARPFEIYLSRGQDAICSARTEARLAASGITVPALDADLLRRHIGFFESAGVLPRRATNHPAAVRDRPVPLQLVRQIEASLAANGAGMRADSAVKWRWERVALDTRDGLLNEAAALGGGPACGLQRYRVTPLQVHAPYGTDIVIKLKADDRALTRAIVEIARLADPELGQVLQRQPAVLGLADAHRREPALYRLAPAGARSYMARCYGTLEQQALPVTGETGWGLALAYRRGRVGGWSRSRGWDWGAQDTSDAILALADLHAAWYRHGLQRISTQAPLCRPMAARQGLALMPAWRAMADFAAPIFECMGVAELPRLHRHLLDTMAAWWGCYDSLPVTLIHNDYNPRNLVLPAEAAAHEKPATLCVLDWELATIGPPQQDLAELLCFVLAPGANDGAVTAAVELHRNRLNAATGLTIAYDEWIQGFELALNRLLVQRLPFYALVHRFQPQPFLPMLLTNWVRLKRWSQRTPADNRVRPYEPLRVQNTAALTEAAVAVALNQV